MSKLFMPVALVALVLVVAACGDDEQGATEAQTTIEQAGGGSGDQGAGGEQGEPGTTIATGDSQVGEALFDGDQRAIYYFDKETSERSECYGACAEAWPPVLTDGEPVADSGADAKLLGTSERNDGSTQVTYDGKPLYYYVDDPKGEILCHNVDEFGGLWLAVQPNGEAVQ
jgi:predicted lipoprotein with Yx(FWY)xxD motif